MGSHECPAGDDFQVEPQDGARLDLVHDVPSDRGGELVALVVGCELANTDTAHVRAVTMQAPSPTDDGFQDHPLQVRSVPVRTPQVRTPQV